MKKSKIIGVIGLALLIVVVGYSAAGSIQSSKAATYNSLYGTGYRDSVAAGSTRAVRVVADDSTLNYYSTGYGWHSEPAYYTKSTSLTFSFPSISYSTAWVGQGVTNYLGSFCFTLQEIRAGSTSGSNLVYIDLGRYDNTTDSVYTVMEKAKTGNGYNRIILNDVETKPYYTSYNSSTTLAQFDAWLQSLSFTIQPKSGYFYTVGISYRINGKKGRTTYTQEESFQAYDIICDTSAPNSSSRLYAAGIQVDNGSIVNADNIYFTSSDSHGLTGCYVKTPGASSYSIYTSGTQLTNEGEYNFYAIDRAGNISNIYTITIDRTAPVGFLTTGGVSASSGGITNKQIIYNATDTNFSKIYYKMDSYSAYSSTTAASFTVDAVYANNGTWNFYAEDKAGNISGIINITLDTVLPDNGSLPAITNKDIVFSPTDIYGIARIYYKKDNESYTSTTSTRFTIYANSGNNGVWYFYAEDTAGNVSIPISSIIDTIPPANVELPKYTNQNIILNASDISGVAKIYYRQGDTGNYSSVTGSSYTITAGAANNGIWYYYAEDAVGNKSSASSVVMSVIDTFGNASQIYNSYKVTSWYKLTLPARVFTTADKDIAGTYTFDSYETALSFAIAKETEFRVSTITGGWIYVSATNESVSQIYTDKTNLDAAIKKYASAYISDEQKYTTGSNNYYTTVNDSFINDITALTRQHLSLPAFLNTYSTYPLYLCSTSFSFTKLKLSYASIPSTVQLTYIANDIQLTTQKKISVAYGESVLSALKAADAYNQGYYIVTERDDAGNVEKFLIYIDLEAPELQARVTLGDGNAKDIVFNTDYADTYAGTFYYISFSLCSLYDNADSAYSLVKITGKGIDKIFSAGDALPTLNSDIGTGIYTITLYDRSKNALTFTIVIAGAEPTWTYTSLKNETKLTITISLGDTNNALTSLQLFKIQSDGTYLELAFDDDGTAVNIFTMSYVLRTGGKYTVRLTDLFGRAVEMKPIFYEKDLPVGVLSGVSDGGRTRNDVTFKYSAGNMLIVYIYVNGVKALYNDYTTAYSSVTSTYTVTFLASEETSYEYLLFLYASSDIGLYIEYGFEIDHILSPVNVIDSRGGEVAYDGAVNTSFYLTWTDPNLTVRYYSSKSTGGSLDEKRYTQNTTLSADALYYFTVTDDVGNTLKFTILLDAIVSYQITGEYTVSGGRILTNKPLTITILETYTTFYVTSNNGYTFTNGTPISIDGEYTLYVIDNYGNILELIIVIDKVPPTVELTNVSAGGKTKNPVAVTFASDATGYILNSRGVIQSVFVSGSVFSAHGVYYIRVVNLAGNKTELSFTVDLMVEYSVNVQNRQITSSAVASEFLENVNCSVTRNGIAIEFESKFTAAGRYVIAATDEVGNILIFSFEIIPYRNLHYNGNVPEGYSILKSSFNGEESLIFTDKNGNFTLTDNGIYVIILCENATGAAYELIIEIDNALPEADINMKGNAVVISGISKESYTYTLARDGTDINYTIGKQITAPGKYTLLITDDLGNSNIYYFEIKYKPNTWAVIVIVIGAAAFALLSLILIRSRLRIKVR